MALKNMLQSHFGALLESVQNQLMVSRTIMSPLKESKSSLQMTQHTQSCGSSNGHAHSNGHRLHNIDFHILRHCIIFMHVHKGGVSLDPPSPPPPPPPPPSSGSVPEHCNFLGRRGVGAGGFFVATSHWLVQNSYGTRTFCMNKHPIFLRYRTVH